MPALRTLCAPRPPSGGPGVPLLGALLLHREKQRPSIFHACRVRPSCWEVIARGLAAWAGSGQHSAGGTPWDLRVTLAPQRLEGAEAKRTQGRETPVPHTRAWGSVQLKSEQVRRLTDFSEGGWFVTGREEGRQRGPDGPAGRDGVVEEGTALLQPGSREVDVLRADHAGGMHVWGQPLCGHLL